MMKNPLVNLLGYMWKYSFGTRSHIVIFVSMTIVANLIYLMEPIIVGRVFNMIQSLETDGPFLFSIAKNFSLLILTTVGFWIFHGLSRYIERRNAFLVRKNYKKEMIDKILELPARWHKDHHSGDTIDKINKASEALYDYADNFFLIAENATRLIGAIVLLAIFSLEASAVALAICFVAIFSLVAFDKKLIHGYRKVFRAENFLSSAVYDYISNILTIITLRLKKRVSAEIETRSMKAFPAQKRNIALNEWKWFSANIMISLMIVVTLVMNAYSSFRASGVILIGTLFILYRYLEGVGNTFYTFAWRYGDIVKNNAAVLAAEEINDEYGNLTAKKKKHLPKNWKTILIKNLHFTYIGDDKDEKKESHIEDVSLSIQKGARIALIGESGSGKSTLLALLRGLWEAERGLVFADGKKLDGALAHLYEHVTLIPQEPEIFNSTVEDNISMGTSVSKKELNQAVEIARFSGVLARLKDGLKTNVMEKGVNLSGGEKQRLALARGVLAARDSDFIFLDEPTSSVDSSNELLIYQKIFSHFKDKTIISSVHRLHLLRNFDYIYFFAQGRIKAQGTFTMMLNDPDFKVLWKNYMLETRENGDDSLTKE